MILVRSILKEMLATALACLSVLVLLFLSQFLVRYMKHAASGRIAADTIMILVSAEIPRLLCVLLPLALFLGIILTLGRLRSDHELLIMRMSGFTKRVWGLPYVLFLFFIAFLVFVLAGWGAPWAAHQRAVYTEKTEDQRLLSMLSPGRFQVLNEGRQVVFVERLSKHRNEADGVFIAELKDDPQAPSSILTAKHATFKKHAEYHGVPYFELKDGRRYQGAIGASDYRILLFDRYGFRIRDHETKLTLPEKEMFPLNFLWKKRNLPLNFAELNWRISMPVSVIVLGVFALFFGSERFRRERYMTILMGLSVYFIYMNVILFSREWIERGVWRAAFIMHALPLALLFVTLFFMHRSGKTT